MNKITKAFQSLFRRGQESSAEQKSTELSLELAQGWEILTGGTTYTGKTVSANTLLQMSATWSAIRLISETIGTLPIHLYRRTDKGRERANKHKLYRLLHLQPNPYTTSVEWREAMAVSLCCWGQSYNKVDRLGNRVTGITSLTKQQTNPFINSQGEIQYKVFENGKENTYTRGEILPIKGFGGPGQLEGYPPYKFHRNSLALGVAAEEYAAKFFNNGGRPSALLIGDKWPDKEKSDRLKELLQEAEGKTLVMGGGYSYEQVSASHTEAQLMEIREFQIAEAARIWRVPKSMLMARDGDSTFNNTEQQNIHFLQYTLRPYLVRIEQALNSILLTRDEQKGLYIEFDVNGLLRGDSRSRSEYYRNMRMIGAIKINEVRRLENLPEDPNGDDLHMPLNMAPVDLARESLTRGDDNENG